MVNVGKYTIHGLFGYVNWPLKKKKTFKGPQLQGSTFRDHQTDLPNFQRWECCAVVNHETPMKRLGVVNGDSVFSWLPMKESRKYNKGVVG